MSPPRPNLRFTARPHGDFRPPVEPGADVYAVQLHRYAIVVPHAVTWLRQVHGTRVVTVTRPGEHAGMEADAAVTNRSSCALSVVTADCAPVVFQAANESVVGIAHAGWRGLAGGVLESTVKRMRELGATTINATLGPCIHPCCYEFGEHDLVPFRERYGGAVLATTTAGRPALDVPAATRVALGRVGVGYTDASWCTACSAERSYSHRARRDPQRQAAIVWLESTVESPA